MLLFGRHGIPHASFAIVEPAVEEVRAGILYQLFVVNILSTGGCVVWGSTYTHPYADDQEARVGLEVPRRVGLLVDWEGYVSIGWVGEKGELKTHCWLLSCRLLARPCCTTCRMLVVDQQDR